MKTLDLLAVFKYLHDSSLTVHLDWLEEKC